MIGTTLASRYRVIEKLGAGGMGVVYRAHDARLDRDVALKVLPAGLLHDDEARRRSRREALALSRLSHPLIETIHDFDTDGDVDFLVTELVHGRPLSDLVATGPLPLDEVVRLGLQVAEALEAAHGEGLIHRDVKPANVMVTPEGRVKLLDFGLARVLERAQAGDQAHSLLASRSTHVGGTLGYMAPECFRGEPCDRRADVYGLGVLLYEMAAGSPPFEEKSAERLIYLVLNEPPLPLHARRSGLPEGFEGLVSRCLGKRPSDRPATAREVAGALRDLQGTRAPRRPPVRPRRAPALSLRVALVVTALMVGLAVVRAVRRPGSSALAPNRVAVAMFENLTRDPSFDPLGRIASDWIALGLARTGLLEVVPSVAILQSLEVLSVAGAGGRGAEDLLAEETGAAIVVSGTYYLQDSVLVMHAQITDARRRRLIETLDPVRGPAADALAVVETLRQRVTAALATQLDPALKDWARVASRPPTYEAYEAFMGGMELFARREWRAAIPRFGEAAASDTAYVYARLQEALCHLNLGEPAKVDSIVRLVAPARGRLAALDRAVLEWLEAWLAGDIEQALRAAGVAARLAPSTVWGYQAGLDALLANRPRRACDALRSIRPDRGPMRGWTAYWETLTAAEHMLGDHRAELKEARRGCRMYPNSVSALGNEVRVLAALGRTAELRRRLSDCRRMSAEPGWSEGTVLLLAVRELRAHGHEADAGELAASAIAWYRERVGSGRPAGSDSAALAVALYTARRWEEAQALFARLADEHSSNPHYVAYLGVLAARRGDRPAALGHSGRLEAMRGRWRGGALTYWQADIAALLGEEDRALALLRRAQEEGHEIGFRTHADPDLEMLRRTPAFREALRTKG